MPRNLTSPQDFANVFPPAIVLFCNDNRLPYHEVCGRFAPISSLDREAARLSEFLKL